jgi:hypothetical protein
VLPSPPSGGDGFFVGKISNYQLLPGKSAKMGNNLAQTPLEIYKPFEIMHNQNQTNHPNSLVQTIKNLFNKLRQNPEVYPIKYYKKGQRLRKPMKASVVK